MRLHQFFRRRVASPLAPTAYRDLGAKPEKPLRHRLAEPRAAARDEDFLAGEQIAGEHAHFLPRSMSSAPAGVRRGVDG
jgi:hypothetical protein